MLYKKIKKIPTHSIFYEKLFNKKVSQMNKKLLGLTIPSKKNQKNWPQWALDLRFVKTFESEWT